MELYLQFGHGMMQHCRHLIERWGGGTAVLSPRDLTREQLVRLAADLNRHDGHTLLDPQFYLPHADHERLCSHDYWPRDYDTNAFWQGSALNQLLVKLRDYNDAMSTQAFLLPGLLATRVDDDWLETQRAIVEEANNLGAQKPIVVTLALSSDSTRDQTQIELLLERAATWNAPAYYVVCEHPNGDYLVDDLNWLANVLDLVAGLRLAGAKVILGYSNHQMLVAAAAKASAICSGTWMNVRSFPPDKFRLAYDEEIRQRATWFYCHQSLSEYRVPFLDIAQRQGVLDMMAPTQEFDGGYVTALFSGPQPSTLPFTEQAAFRHYLHSLRQQTLLAEKDAFDTTTANYEASLEGAENTHTRLSAAGVRGQYRDFRNCFDVNRAALSLLSTTRGPMLRRLWSAV